MLDLSRVLVLRVFNGGDQPRINISEFILSFSPEILVKYILRPGRD